MSDDFEIKIHNRQPLGGTTFGFIETSFGNINMVVHDKLNIPINDSGAFAICRECGTAIPAFRTRYIGGKPYCDNCADAKIEENEYTRTYSDEEALRIANRVAGGYKSEPQPGDEEFFRWPDQVTKDEQHELDRIREKEENDAVEALGAKYYTDLGKKIKEDVREKALDGKAANPRIITHS